MFPGGEADYDEGGDVLRVDGSWKYCFIVSKDLQDKLQYFSITDILEQILLLIPLLYLFWPLIAA